MKKDLVEKEHHLFDESSKLPSSAISIQEELDYSMLGKKEEF